MDIEKRLAEVEARLRRAEDHLEILNLLNAYGPLVDSGMAEEAAQLWCDGGGYSFTDPAGGCDRRLEAPEPLASMFRSAAHIDMINTGSGHLTATPKIAVDGDQAHAIGYTFLVRYDGTDWHIWRAAVNHYELRRTPRGWRMVERVNRTLDGSPESQKLMRDVLDLA